MSDSAPISFLPDTSTIIPALCRWHEHHTPALAEMERRLGRGEEMVLAAPALIEAYSVLTRLPAPYRVSAGDARSMLEASFIGEHRVVALSAPGHVALLHGAPEAGVSGGRTYDAVIAACAKQAKVRYLLTFNDSHFRPLLPAAIEVIIPATDTA